MEDPPGARVNEKGFTVLFEAESPIIDIVFIHGFTGDPRGTWTLKKGAKSPRKHDLESAAVEQHGDAIGSAPSKFRKLLSSTRKQPHAKVSTVQPRIASGESSSAHESGRAEGSRAIGDLQQTMQTKYPFLDYATTNVLMHSNQAQSVGVEQNACIAAFPLQHWIKLNNLFEKFEARRYTDQASLLYILAERNCSSLIKIHPQAPKHFDIHGERYSYPLIAAVVLRHEDAVRELVRAVLPNQSDALLHLRGSLDRFPHGREFRCRKYQGLLSFLVEFNHEGMFRYFVETHPVKIDSRDKKGRTLLSLAAEGGREVVANLLLARSDFEPNSKDNYGRTPLLWAAREGSEAVVKLLLENGAELESKDSSGRTPLSWAAERGVEVMVKLLLKKGAELESKDDSGRTPLSWAVGQGSKAVVKLLLEKGAELESRDNSGRTPLSWTVGTAGLWCEAVVKLLLDNGAELESKDSSGRTPLSWAAERGVEVMVKLVFRLQFSAIIEQ